MLRPARLACLFVLTRTESAGLDDLYVGDLRLRGAGREADPALRVRLRQILDQRFQIIWWERFKARRHDGERRCFQLSDVFSLENMLLGSAVEDLDRGLRFGFKPAGECLATLGGHVPEA